MVRRRSRHNIGKAACRIHEVLSHVDHGVGWVRYCRLFAHLGREACNLTIDDAASLKGHRVKLSALVVNSVHRRVQSCHLFWRHRSYVPVSVLLLKDDPAVHNANDYLELRLNAGRTDRPLLRIGRVDHLCCNQRLVRLCPSLLVTCHGYFDLFKFGLFPFKQKLLVDALLFRVQIVNQMVLQSATPLCLGRLLLF